MWEAVLDDGSVVSQKNTKWSEIKGRVKGLRFHYHGIIFELPPNQKTYGQATTASAAIASGPVEAQVESRWISFSPDGVRTIRMRFSEKEKRVSVEQEG